jgi:hypothetical protein
MSLSLQSRVHVSFHLFGERVTSSRQIEIFAALFVACVRRQARGFDRHFTASCDLLFRAEPAKVSAAEIEVQNQAPSCPFKRERGHVISVSLMSLGRPRQAKADDFSTLRFRMGGVE